MTSRPPDGPDRRTFMQQTAGAMAAFAIHPSLGELGRLAPGQAPLGVGLVGAGRHGRHILAELQKIEQAQVTAICDISAARVRSGLRRAKGSKPFDDYRKLLEAPGIDAVVVATPTHRHREVAIAALEAGKHVYCEAPLASTAEDARAIARAARSAGTVFQTGLLARSNPIYKLARTFFRSGAARDLVSLRAQDHRKISWRTPSSDPARAVELNWRIDGEVSIGLAGELGTHQFDAFHWFLGAYPTSVRGSGAIRFYKDGRDVADTVSCELTFPDGALLNWEGTLANSFGGRFEIYHGSMAAFKMAWTAGWMFKEADAATQGWEVYANRESFHNDEGITLIADATKLAKAGKLKEGVGLPNRPLYYGLADFVRSVTEQQPVVCSAEEGLRAAVVGIHANQAVVTGETVAIDPKSLEVG